MFSIRIISIKGYNLFVSLSLSRQVKWRAAPIEVYLKFRLMLRLPLASIKFCFTSSLPLASFCYRKNQQKLSAATRLPLACIKFCLQNFLRQKLSAATRLPLACIKFCLQNFLRQKLSAATRLPLGGRLRREAVVRGATCFLSELFQSRVATCSSAPFHQTKPLINSPARPASIRTQE